MKKARREFRFQDGKSNKFWAISLSGDSHTVHYGRAGTEGQTKTKEFASTEAALKSYEKLIAAKTKKGYVEGKASKKKTASRKKTAAVGTRKAGGAAAARKSSPAEQLARKLVRLNQGVTRADLERLYAEDVVSYESGQSEPTRGIDGLAEKLERFESLVRSQSWKARLAKSPSNTAGTSESPSRQWSARTSPTRRSAPNEKPVPTRNAAPSVERTTGPGECW